MDEYVFQPIMTGMAEHHPQRFHSVGAEILGAGELRCAVTRELRQQARGVIFAVNAVGVGIG